MKPLSVAIIWLYKSVRGYHSCVRSSLLLIRVSLLDINVPKSQMFHSNMCVEDLREALTSSFSRRKPKSDLYVWIYLGVVQVLPRATDYICKLTQRVP